jgi:hypothetical protein
MKNVIYALSTLLLYVVAFAVAGTAHEIGKGSGIVS